MVSLRPDASRPEHQLACATFLGCGTSSSGLDRSRELALKPHGIEGLRSIGRSNSNSGKDVCENDPYRDELGFRCHIEGAS